MEEQVKKTIENLKEVFGQAEVLAVAEIILGQIRVSCPAEYIPIVAPKKLKDTLDELGFAAADLLEKGKAREEAYGEKETLVERQRWLTTAIKLTETSAIMSGVSGDGKSAIWEGRTYPYSNDPLRDAFRRMVSGLQRTELAETEGKIARIDVQLFRAKDAWEAADRAAHMIERKAYVQAETLAFLAFRK